MPQLHKKIDKKSEKRLVCLSKKFCKKMLSIKISDISPSFDTTVLNDFNKYINNIYHFNDLFKISEFTKQINDMGESLKNITHDFRFPSISSPILSDRKIIDIGKLMEESDKDFDTLRDETKKLELNETNFGIVFVEKSGSFKYKNRLLKISIDSNSGKFLRYVIGDKDHFIPDEYCQHEFSCPTTKEITYITRDLNKIYLNKDNLKAKLRRCRDAKGYVLEEVVEFKS